MSTLKLLKSFSAMDGSLAAAQRVLAIPELLALIIEALPSGYSDPRITNNRAAAKCMYVSQMWYAVAVRSAWRFCGGKWRIDNSTDCKRKEKERPWIYDLVKMISCRERLQWHANFIESLETSKDVAMFEPILDEARFNHLLVDFRFPRLKHAALKGMNVTPSIGQFLQPQLKHLYFITSSLSDFFFLSLAVPLALPFSKYTC